MNKQHKPIEIFTPPNTLKAKVGGSGGTLDMSAVKRAEEALATLKTEFGDWIAADVKMLTDLRDAFVADPSDERRGDLYRASHDLRGQARTFEFPLVERVAASLCRLLDAPGAREGTCARRRPCRRHSCHRPRQHQRPYERDGFDAGEGT